MEDFPTQACSSSGFPSQLQPKFFAQTQNQTGSYSVEYLPVLVTTEATSKADIDKSQVEQNTIQLRSSDNKKHNLLEHVVGYHNNQK